MVAADADTGKIGSILTSSRLGTLRILWVAIALLLARAKVILGLTCFSVSCASLCAGLQFRALVVRSDRRQMESGQPGPAASLTILGNSSPPPGPHLHAQLLTDHPCSTPALHPRMAKTISVQHTPPYLNSSRVSPIYNIYNLEPTWKRAIFTHILFPDTAFLILPATRPELVAINTKPFFSSSTTCFGRYLTYLPMLQYGLLRRAGT